jgi:hypothetical protein
MEAMFLQRRHTAVIAANDAVAVDSVLRMKYARRGVPADILSTYKIAVTAYMPRSIHA